jgi:hypothetical protein
MIGLRQMQRTALAGLDLLLQASRQWLMYIWERARYIRALRLLRGQTVRGFDIRRFDREIVRASALWDNGYIRYPKAPAEILDAARHLMADENVVIDEATFPIVAYLVSLVRADVVSYLGTNVRIDNICVNVVPATAETFKSVSGSWHTDNVGHRLKLFFCIEGFGDVPTCYRPGSNRRPYRPSVRENRRLFGHIDVARQPDEIRLNHATGDIILFDTNGEHRGAYDQNHRIRRVLLIEFADRKKSDHLAGWSAIGPGNTSCRVFSISKSIADVRALDLMLDPTLLIAETKETYRYDRPARNV